MAERKIYLIRHGETAMNREERLQGQIDCELNETGISEAERTARILQNAGITAGRIYSSPLRRAAATAGIIAAGRPVTIEPLITEMHFGDYEGMRYKDIDEKMWAFIHDPENVPPPAGVESIRSLTSRTGRFLEMLMSDGTTDNIIAVTHGIALRSMLWNLYPADKRHGVWGLPIENCIIYELTVIDGRPAGIRKADELSITSGSDTSAVF